MSLLVFTCKNRTPRDVGNVKRPAEDDLEISVFDAYEIVLKRFQYQLNINISEKRWGVVFSETTGEYLSDIIATFENMYEHMYPRNPIMRKTQTQTIIMNYLADSLTKSIDFCLMLLHMSIENSKIKTILYNLVRLPESTSLVDAILACEKSGKVLSMPFDIYTSGIKKSIPDPVPTPYNVILWNLSDGGYFDEDREENDFFMNYAYQVCMYCPISDESKEIITIFKDLKTKFVDKRADNNERAIALLSAVLLISIVSLEENDLKQIESNPSIITFSDTSNALRNVQAMLDDLKTLTRQDLFFKQNTLLLKIVKDIEKVDPDTNCQAIILPLLNATLQINQYGEYRGSCLDSTIWHAFYQYQKGNNGYVYIEHNHFGFEEGSPGYKDADLLTTKNDEMVFLWLAFGAIPRFLLPQLEIKMNGFYDDPITIVNRRKRVCPIIASVLNDMEIQEDKDAFFKTLITRNKIF